MDYRGPRACRQDPEPGNFAARADRARRRRARWTGPRAGRRRPGGAGAAAGPRRGADELPGGVGQPRPAAGPQQSRSARDLITRGQRRARPGGRDAPRRCPRRRGHRAGRGRPVQGAEPIRHIGWPNRVPPGRVAGCPHTGRIVGRGRRGARLACPRHPEGGAGRALSGGRAESRIARPGSSEHAATRVLAAAATPQGFVAAAACPAGIALERRWHGLAATSRQVTSGRAGPKAAVPLKPLPQPENHTPILPMSLGTVPGPSVAGPAPARVLLVEPVQVRHRRRWWRRRRSRTVICWSWEDSAASAAESGNGGRSAAGGCCTTWAGSVVDLPRTDPGRSRCSLDR